MRIGESELNKAIDYLKAGDWQLAHELVQKDEESALACWAHGIVHLMEGNEANARYWFRKAGQPVRERPSIAEEIKALKSVAEMGRTKS